jgi:flagellar protein FlaI
MAESTAEEGITATEESTLTFKDSYPVNPPFGFVGIERDETNGSIRYLTIEPTLTEDEERVLRKVKSRLLQKMDIPLAILKDEERLEAYLRGQIKRSFKRFRESVAKESEEKFIYYLKVGLLGYGKIDLLMRDENIEDISCNGVNTPIYVWHRNYESIPTNISYPTDQELKAIVTRLAYRAGHQISVARPILEGTLPEGFRIHLTLDDVSKRGDTFTIRKYRPSPYTIVDLIKFGTLSPKVAAYLWLMVENLRSIMVCGATASGKTSLLNAICTFIRPEVKVVTIEEVRELRLHENWIPMVTRPSFLPAVQDVTLYDLLSSALRQRPDYIIVGEVRGKEAYTLFQSMAVGHGGLCTIHADSFDSVIKRLLTRPMEIPKMLLPLMNVLISVQRVNLGDKLARRVLGVGEVIGATEDGVHVENRFEWDPAEDTFKENAPALLGQDVFSAIAKTKHTTLDKVKEEHRRREEILKWMVKRDIRTYDEAAGIIRDYHLKPDETYDAAIMWSE